MIKRAVILKAIVFNEEGQVLLVRRSKSAPRRPLEWDLPGGFLDERDGSYQEACLRELREETGLKAVDGTVYLAYAESSIDHESRPQSYDVARLYFAMQTAADAAVRLSREHSEFTWVTLERAQGLITYDTQLRALAYLGRVRELTEKP